MGRRSSAEACLSDGGNQEAAAEQWKPLAFWATAAARERLVDVADAELAFAKASLSIAKQMCGEEGRWEDIVAVAEQNQVERWKAFEVWDALALRMLDAYNGNRPLEELSLSLHHVRHLQGKSHQPPEDLSRPHESDEGAVADYGTPSILVLNRILAAQRAADAPLSLQAKRIVWVLAHLQDLAWYPEDTIRERDLPVLGSIGFWHQLLPDIQPILYPTEAARILRNRFPSWFEVEKELPTGLQSTFSYRNGGFEGSVTGSLEEQLVTIAKWELRCDWPCQDVTWAMDLVFAGAERLLAEVQRRESGEAAGDPWNGIDLRTYMRQVKGMTSAEVEDMAKRLATEGSQPKGGGATQWLRENMCDLCKEISPARPNQLEVGAFLRTRWGISYSRESLRRQMGEELRRIRTGRAGLGS